jgi:hypothetical protein
VSFYVVSDPRFQLFICKESQANHSFHVVIRHSASECPSGQACFEIRGETCTSAAPTLQPTNATVPEPVPSLPPVSLAPTATKSESPTNSPAANVHFCGSNYTDAVARCSFETACPGGFECPSSMMCFAGITTCPATTAPGPSPVTLDDVSDSPVVGSVAFTNAPTVLAETSNRYCGVSIEDAIDNCATNIPCPDGTGASCLTGQTCFPIPDTCESIPAIITSAPSMASIQVTTTASPTPAPSDKPVFDPNNTSFCGTTYDEAKDNCYTTTPCPNNSNAECPMGLTCFPGITDCPIPSTASPSGAPTDKLTVVPVEGPPSRKPTPQPTWDFQNLGGEPPRSSASMYGSLSTKALILSGSVVGIITFMV